MEKSGVVGKRSGEIEDCGKEEEEEGEEEADEEKVRLLVR